MKRIWIEYLRVLATLGVIVIHTTASLYSDFGHIPAQDWWTANILNTLSRFSVPMFVMISGCVLLGRSMGTRDFYIHRGIRLLPAFFFWSFFYVAFSYFFQHGDAGKAWRQLTIDFIGTGSTHYHLWYLSMFICLMMFVPFINGYITGKKPELEDFCFLLAAIAIFMTLNQISSMGRDIIGKGMSWFKLFPWFLGYLLMGYCIDHYQDRIRLSNKLAAFMLVILLALACMLNFYSVSRLGIVKDYFILNNTGILCFMVTALIFYLFSSNRQAFPESGVIRSIAAASFGIYLVHPVFLFFLKKPVLDLAGNLLVGVPLVAALTFLLSYLTAAALGRVKVLKAIC